MILVVNPESDMDLHSRIEEVYHVMSHLIRENELRESFPHLNEMYEDLTHRLFQVCEGDYNEDGC